MGERPIVCSNCGASTADGDEFEVHERILVVDIRSARVSAGGIDASEVYDTGLFPTPGGRPELACACGHSWPTRRPIRFGSQEETHGD